MAQLSAQQDLFYANDRYALLLIFQAMDAAGKDGAIKHVMSGVNPQGCRVVSFKHPSAEELDHDFLWRTTRHLPERGMTGIFNRSHFEEVLIARVHPEILAAQSLPSELVHPKTIWQERYRSIVELEGHLGRNGTRNIKFYLHLSKAEQRRRFRKRIDDADKNWKFNLADMEERRFWKRYVEAYQACLGAHAGPASAHPPPGGARRRRAAPPQAARPLLPVVIPMVSTRSWGDPVTGGSATRRTFALVRERALRRPGLASRPAGKVFLAFPPGPGRHARCVGKGSAR